MLLDRKNNAWAIAFVVLLVAGTAAYVPYHLNAMNGPSGGSWPGLIFGIIGFGMLLFVGLLGVRRYFPAWRVGRTEMWMRGHLWLGLLGFAMILFHGGFQFGGTLTTVLMWLLIVLTVSGVYGVILQQVMPRLMTSQIRLETIYEQIPHVVMQLQAEAEETLKAIGAAVEEPATAGAAKRDWSGIPDSGVRKGVAEAPKEGGDVLRDFYMEQVRPYLADKSPDSALSHSGRSTVVFANVKGMLPPPLHETLSDLEDICEEYRQLMRQKRLHNWLHGWLLVHVPLSYAFLVLAIVHAIYSMSY